MDDTQPEPQPETLGAILFRWRGSLTQEELAELSGVDQTTISAIERGLRSMSRAQATKLAAVLVIDPADLGRAFVAPVGPK